MQQTRSVLLPVYPIQEWPFNGLAGNINVEIDNKSILSKKVMQKLTLDILPLDIALP